MKTYSLRRSILGFVFVPLCLAIIVSVGLTLWSAYERISGIYDAQMQQMADTLSVLMRHEALEGEDIRITLGSKAAQLESQKDSRMAYRIWGDGVLVTMSANAVDLGSPAKSSGFDWRKHLGKAWRTYTWMSPDDDITVEITQDAHVRSDLVWTVLNSLIVPGLLLISSIALIIILGIRRVVRPVRLLSAELDARGADHLDPLKSQAIPEEVAPMFRALNSLFERVSATLTREREFTDNAAHELRTPLAALKLRAQLLAKQLGRASKSVGGMSDLLITIDRMTALVEQLLTFSRLQAQKPALVPLDFAEIVNRVAQDMSPMALAHGQVIQMRIEPDLTIRGDEAALYILVRNIIDNGLGFTPSGESLDISVYSQGDTVVLRVADRGPGIPADMRDQVFERFRRLDTRRVGSGLGLAIVRWIVDAFGATIHLSDSEPHGLIFEVAFRQAD